MSGNIETREILKMFLDYPDREDWPEEEELDAKGKKANPKDKKPPKKKKKVKQPDYPAWGLELVDVRKYVDKMKKLVNDRVNLKLEDEFVKEVEGAIKKMMKEINHRQMLEDEAREEMEAKLLKSKNKKAAKK